jgi:hypothetical protein
LAVDFREVDLRDADFAGRLTIAIAAFPRWVIAGPPRGVLVAPLGRAANTAGFEFGMRSGVARRRLLLHRISLHVSNPAISGRSPRGAR